MRAKGWGTITSSKLYQGGRHKTDCEKGERAYLYYAYQPLGSPAHTCNNAQNHADRSQQEQQSKV